MRRTKQGAALAAIFGSVLSLPVSASDSHEDDRSRVVLALLGGKVVADAPTSTPAGDPKAVAGVTAGLALSYEHRLDDRFSLAAVASFSEWVAGAAFDQGYSYGRLDLGLAPHVSFVRGGPRHMRKWPELWIALPVGLTRTFGSAPPRRAFDERIDGSWGWYAGAAIGAAWLFGRWGILVEPGYSRHVADTVNLKTPHDPTIPPVSDAERHVDHEIQVRTGVLVTF